MTYIPFLALLGGSVVGTAAEGIINGILNFITSPYFTALIVIEQDVLGIHDFHIILGKHSQLGQVMLDDGIRRQGDQDVT